MKKAIVLLVSIFFGLVLATNTGYAQECKTHKAKGKTTISTVNQQDVVSATYEVDGVCGMCKNRIENAALSLDGVISADWSMETHKLNVTYKKDVNPDQILKAIADAGHDNEKFKAPDVVYNNLPNCCHYRDKDKHMD